MDYRVHGILQARILEWVAYPFSSGSSRPRNWTYIAGGFFTKWAIREAHQPLRWGFPKSSLPFSLFPSFYSLEISPPPRSSPLGEGFPNSLRPCLPAPVPDLCLQFSEWIDPHGYLGGPSNVATWNTTCQQPSQKPSLSFKRQWPLTPWSRSEPVRHQETAQDQTQGSFLLVPSVDDWGLRGGLAQLPIGRKVREALVLTVTSMADCFLRDGGNDYRTLGLLLWRTNKTRGRLTQLLGSLTHCILFELLICWFIKLEVYYIGKWILPVFKCK